MGANKMLLGKYPLSTVYWNGKTKSSEWQHDTPTDLDNNGDLVARQSISFTPRT